MKIKKADNKPIVIHKKERARLHIHVPSKKEETKKPQIDSKGAKGDMAGRRRFKRTKEIAKTSNRPVKVKSVSLKVTGAAGARMTTDQLDGGREIRDSTVVAYTLTSPVIKASRTTVAKISGKSKDLAKAKLKKVEAGDKIARKPVQSGIKDVEGTVKSAKPVQKKAPFAGKTNEKKINAADMKKVNRTRKLKYFLDKTNNKNEQASGVGNVLKDMLLKKVASILSIVLPLLGMALLPLILIIGAIAGIIMAVVAFIYSTPFAIFLPPLEDGDTVNTVASAYYTEFNRDVNTEADDCTGYDMSMIVYTGPPDNYDDVRAVYMTKYGNGDTATIMTDSAKDNLQKVVDDMCSYTVSSGYEDTLEPGGTATTKYIKYVNVTLKTYEEMIDEYGFDEEQIEMIEKLMSPEYMGSY